MFVGAIHISDVRCDVGMNLVICTNRLAGCIRVVKLRRLQCDLHMARIQKINTSFEAKRLVEMSVFKTGIEMLGQNFQLA